MKKLIKKDAKKIYSNIEVIHEDVITCRKLMNSDWLYETKQPVTEWNKNRLDILVKHLGHTSSIPLLLAASKLKEKDFAGILEILEKAFFRYKKISNQHEGELNKIYYDESLSIRKAPDKYKVSSLKSKLKLLVEEKANDEIFKSNLSAFMFRKGVSRKPLKYLLMTIDEHISWIKKGSKGQPKTLDKSSSYNFGAISIEHIYSQNMSENDQNSEMEKVKNSLGNLTIMDISLNNKLENKSFLVKRDIYKSSKVEITRDIGNKKKWTIKDVEEHKEMIVNSALNIFVL